MRYPLAINIGLLFVVSACTGIDPSAANPKKIGAPANSDQPINQDLVGKIETPTLVNTQTKTQNSSVAISCQTSQSGVSADCLINNNSQISQATLLKVEMVMPNNTILEQTITVNTSPENKAETALTISLDPTLGVAEQITVELVSTEELNQGLDQNLSQAKDEVIENESIPVTEVFVAQTADVTVEASTQNKIALVVQAPTEVVQSDGGESVAVTSAFLPVMIDVEAAQENLKSNSDPELKTEVVALKSDYSEVTADDVELTYDEQNPSSVEWVQKSDRKSRDDDDDDNDDYELRIYYDYDREPSSDRSQFIEVKAKDAKRGRHSINQLAKKGKRLMLKSSKVYKHKAKDRRKKDSKNRD